MLLSAVNTCKSCSFIHDLHALRVLVYAHAAVILIYTDRRPPDWLPRLAVLRRCTVNLEPANL